MNPADNYTPDPVGPVCLLHRGWAYDPHGNEYYRESDLCAYAQALADQHGSHITVYHWGGGYQSFRPTSTSK